MSHSLHPSTLIPPSTPSRLTSITVPSHHRYRPPKRSPARRVGSQAAVRLCLSHSPSSVTPANTPSSSRVASPVAAQGQTQGSFHPQSQISSHISANDLPSDAVLVQINDVPPQQSPQITQLPTQQPMEPNKPPGLSEDRFKSNSMQFTRSRGN